MITAPAPEMLWERTDPEAELRRRFGFDSTAAAVGWTADLLAEEYGLQVIMVDRVVVSAHNLMVWVRVDDDRRLMIKICRLVVAHDWLDARAALVGWLAERGHPVAAPVRTRSGDHQLLRDKRSVGVQPVLAGALLDVTDHDQVRAAGTTLAALHVDLAAWPDAARLEHVGPVAGRHQLWALSEEHARTLPPDLVDRLRRQAAELPELPRQPIHTDFRGANVLYQDGRITGVIDFEEARLDPAMADLAHAVCLLGTWYHDWRPMTAEAQTLLVDSYAARRPLSDEERAWLSPLVGWWMLGQGWLDDARRWLTG